MVVFPNCKINLGLRILSKRADGFHNLETVFIPIALHDVLEVITGITPAMNPINFTQTGFTVSGSQQDNLCVKAYRLLQKDFPQLPPVQLHLHKAIPMGAGLGGGSADAAFTLKLLNEKYQLNIPEQQLINYALALGSDCPFFIINKPCYATGRGETLTPIHVNLSGYNLVLVNPGVHINTGWAFAQLAAATGKATATELPFPTILEQPIQHWKNDLVNDFEMPVFKLHSELKEIKEELYRCGALFAAMSGSGSTLYGIFHQTAEPVFNFHEYYFIKTLVLK